MSVLKQSYVVVSGENIDLAKAEIDSLLELESIENTIQWYGNIALLYTNRAVEDLLVNRAALIKEIGISARKDLEAFFGVHVFIDLRVKVMKDWAKRDDSLKRLGYR